ncbi:hypothetical protein AA23498_1206 [Acetobacter nitrogenifigens DSM 23921 = NBRC 105050]|uniref:Uncharacterized protein n=1 Tax=Acetobacter nitrogenifigens DSM 23921 = NBRC 105050 TaxID=1120919 RepID=A0A511XD10_9PROT|nr:hypothetical protein [Acetobacter nitrogenifigens]GBQ91523.1 hypothetical protein AA23498_1206 [Acetobacter nitrogenifigens DSM 23921 = NBRC 105050]GEN60843.1 hypothetical protein ANI02nite_27270 [Acetobacter nitrogenifigens DSM 23921 = NBRC 105050]
MTDFPEGRAPIDPKAAAIELLRLFGAEAEEIAHRRIVGFMDDDDMDRVREWYMVKGHIRELTHGIRRAGQSIN